MVENIVETRNLLESPRAATGTMRITPTEALELALCIYPLDLTVIEAACITVYRLKCQGEWRDTRLGRTRLRWLYIHPFTLAQDRTLRNYQIHKDFKALAPTRLAKARLNNQLQHKLLVYRWLG